MFSTSFYNQIITGHQCLETRQQSTSHLSLSEVGDQFLDSIFGIALSPDIVIYLFLPKLQCTVLEKHFTPLS